MPRKSATTLAPIGDDIALHTGGSGQAAAVLADGGFAVVAAMPEDALGGPLQVFRFAADGSSSGGSSPVSTIGQPFSGFYSAPEITPLSGGGFVVTWVSPFSHSQAGDFAVYDGAGGFQNGGEVGNGYITGFSAIPLGNGDYALFTALGSLFGQDAALSFSGAGPEIVFNQRSDQMGGLNFQETRGVDVDGGTELLWADSQGLHAGLMRDSGTVTDRLVDDGPVTELDVARLSDGRVVATWAEDTLGGDTQIWAVTFDPEKLDADRGRDPEKFLVGTTEAFGFNADPEVVALSGGGFAISWRVDDPDGFTEARLFDRQGRGGAAFDAEGDFVGVDAQGRVVAARIDGAGEVFVQLYGASTGPTHGNGRGHHDGDTPFHHGAQSWFFGG